MKSIKFVLAVIVLLLGLNLQAQTQQDICKKYSKEKAEAFVAKKQPRLVVIGGIKPAITAADKRFEKKYKMKFIDTGCAVDEETCIADFNKIAAHYLDKKYGKAWRKHIRKDIAGIE